MENNVLIRTEHWFIGSFLAVLCVTLLLGWRGETLVRTIRKLQERDRKRHTTRKESVFSCGERTTEIAYEELGVSSDSDFEFIESVGETDSQSSHSTRLSINSIQVAGKNNGNGDRGKAIASIGVRLKHETVASDHDSEADTNLKENDKHKLHLMIGNVTGKRGKYFANKITTSLVAVTVEKTNGHPMETSDDEAKENHTGDDIDLRTKIKKDAYQQEFNESYDFELSQDPDNYTLVFSLVAMDLFARSSPIGRAVLNLSKCDLSDIADYKLSFAPTNTESGCKLLLALNYLPLAERLCVTVMKAANLQRDPALAETFDCFVKVVISVGDKKTQKKKTPIVQNNCNPVFNETLGFDVSKAELSNTRVSAWVAQQVLPESQGPTGSLRDSISGRGRMRIFGVVTISQDSAGWEEKQHFAQMYDSPRRPVAHWHQLNNFSF